MQTSEEKRAAHLVACQKYRKTHPNRVSESQRMFHEAHPDAKSKIQSKYHATHRNKVNEKNRKWREDHPEQMKEFRLNWAKAHPNEVRGYNRKSYANNSEKRLEHAHRTDVKERQRMNYIKRTYGVTDGEAQRLLIARRSGVCVICGENRSGKKELEIDHDHDTGLIRGVICQKCNTGLGAFNDDLELLECVVDYMKQAKDRTAHNIPE